jgi:isoleucyl-tRNA synthetase
MDLVRKICELGHAARKEAGIKVRQPLQELRIENLEFRIDEELIQLIKDELNVKEVMLKTGKGEIKVTLDTRLTLQLKAEGEARELVRQIQELRKKANCRLDQKIKVYGPKWPEDKDLREYIKKETLTKELLSGKELKITTLND